MGYIWLCFQLLLAAVALTMPTSLYTRITSDATLPDSGTAGLICHKPSFYDGVTFFVLNYLLHATTVKRRPGESMVTYSLAVVAALVYPYAGVMRGLESIFRRAMSERKSQLQMACSAGALAIVVRRDDWLPIPGDSVMTDLKIEKSKEYRLHGSDRNDATPMSLLPLSGAIGNSAQLHVHPPNDGSVGMVKHWYSPRPPLEEGYPPPKIKGMHILPKGYRLVILPSNAVVVPEQDGKPDEYEVPSSYSLPRIIASTVQLVVSSVTLYSTRGRQLERFGFASFGLTVIPYLLMSAVNLIGSACTPDYDTMYLVDSPELQEARLREGANFQGVTGRVIPIEKTQDQPISVNYDAATSCLRLLTDDLASAADTDAIDRTARLSSNDDGSIALRLVTRKETGALDIFVPCCTLFRTKGSMRWNFDKRVPRTVYWAMMNPLLVANMYLIQNLSWVSVLKVPLAAVPFAVIGGLTNFRKGDSTLAQQIWTMTWLVANVLFGLIGILFNTKENDTRTNRIVLLLLSAPAIGGFVVVGQMFVAFGGCVKVD